MLVRWSLDRRTALAPQHASSEISDCSEGSEDCNNADIPGVGVDDTNDDNDTTPGSPRKNTNPSGAEAEWGNDVTPGPNRLSDTAEDLATSRSSLPTPRPTESSEQSFFPSMADSSQQSLGSNLSPDSPGKPGMQPRRVFTDELAQQSRDDKLIDAAGGSSVTPLTHTPLADKGDSLTEANVEKFQREELRRRLTSEDGHR